MANETVNVNINYKVNVGEVAKAEAATKKADAATNKLRQSTSTYGKEVGQAGKAGSKAMDDVAKSTQKVDTSFGALVGAVKTFLSALAVKEIATAALSMATLAGNIEGVERAFKKIPDSARLMAELKRVTQGTVTDLQLMQTAIKAQNFQIPLNQLGNLLEFAAAKAQQTGESVDYMVDSIITGIGRESPLILDNLQLRMADIKKVMEETGVALGEAVGIIAQRQLQEMGGLAETGAVKVEKLKTAWVNALGDMATKFYEESGVASMIDKMTSFLTESADFSSQREFLASVGVELSKQTTSGRFSDFSPEEQKLIRDQVNALTKSVSNLSEEYDVVTISQMGVREATEILTEEFSKYFLVISDAEKAALSFIESQITQYEVDRRSTLLRAEMAKQAEEDLARKQRELALDRQVALEMFKAAQAEEIQAYVTKNLNKELEELEKSMRAIAQLSPLDIEINVPDFEDVDLSGFSEEAQKKARFRVRSGFAAIRDTAKAMREEIAVESINIAQDQLNSIIFAEVDAYQVRLDNLRSFYDEQISLAGDNTRAKTQLDIKYEREASTIRKQMAEKDKAARRYSTVIDTAAGVMKAFATAPNIYVAIVQAALVAATGISQLVKINREQPRGFARGGLNIQGPGTATSDSIPARLSKGESVLTAAETKRSFGLLQAIRAKKIDDSVIKDLQVGRDGVKYVGMSDKRIVAAIEAQRSPDYMMIGSTAYEARKARDGSRKIIRSKSMGL